MKTSWTALNGGWRSAVAIFLTTGLLAGQTARASASAIAQPAQSILTLSTLAQPGLTFQRKTFYSRGMGKVRPYGLILPPNYNAEPQRRYPVIFFLHGGKGTSSSWIDMGLLRVLKQLYQEGKLPPSIVILPDGNDNRSRIPKYDPYYFDGPYGKISTLIGQDLPTEVKQQYRVVSNPNLWAIGGFSSGGWGALNIGLRHISQFRVFFSHIGYFTDSSGWRNSPQSFIKSFPAAKRKSIRIYLDAGRDDELSPRFLASTQRFDSTLTRFQVPHQFNSFPGGHGRTGSNFGWNYTRKNSVHSLTYVGEQFFQTIAADPQRATGTTASLNSMPKASAEAP
jgi:enterochelin esterase-like enzyme